MAAIATAVVTPTVHRFNLNALFVTDLLSFVSPKRIAKKSQLILCWRFFSLLISMNLIKKIEKLARTSAVCNYQRVIVQNVLQSICVSMGAFK